MKGHLHKTREGWFVIFDQRTMQDPSAEDGMLPLHPHNVAVSSFSFYNGKEVEFEIIQYDGTIPILNAWNGYAKLIDSYPVSEETKSHSFCETPEEKCTMSYCDENGCINRKRNLVGEPKLSTSSQTEISDEEIEKQAYQFKLDYENVGVTEFEVSAFIIGMKKYREQLKQKL